MLNANWKQEGSGKKYRLKPYWANPAIRNFREGGGNIGIIEAQLAPLLYSTLNVVSILVLMESTFRPFGISSIPSAEILFQSLF